MSDHDAAWTEAERAAIGKLALLAEAALQPVRPPLLQKAARLFRDLPDGLASRQQPPQHLG